MALALMLILSFREIEFFPSLLRRLPHLVFHQWHHHGVSHQLGAAPPGVDLLNIPEENFGSVLNVIKNLLEFPVI